MDDLYLVVKHDDVDGLTQLVTESYTLASEAFAFASCALLARLGEDGFFIISTK